MSFGEPILLAGLILIPLAALVYASMQARSGPLARLFASMSAGVTQQLVALPRELS